MKKIKNPFKIKLTYQNSIGETYEDEYLIDFSHLIGLSQLGDPLYKIAKNIENIQKDIHNLSIGFHKMKVISYTKEDMEKEEKQMLERINKKGMKDR